MKTKSDCSIASKGFCKGDCYKCDSMKVAEVLALSTTHDNLELIEDCLKELGYIGILDTLSSKVKKVKGEDKFYCSVLETDIYVPCSVSNCNFWIDQDSVKNCLLYFYKVRESSEDVSIKEISDVLKLSQTEVTKKLETGLTLLRQMAIGIPIGSKDLQESFEFLNTKSICCVCEKQTPEELTDILQVHELGLAYCSLMCRVKKNPTIIKLESKFHADISDILSWSLENFSSITSMEEALEMDSYAIQQMILQYLGKEALSTFPGSINSDLQPFSSLFSFLLFRILNNCWTKSTPFSIKCCFAITLHFFFFNIAIILLYVGSASTVGEKIHTLVPLVAHCSKARYITVVFPERVLAIKHVLPYGSSKKSNPLTVFLDKFVDDITGLMDISFITLVFIYNRKI